MAAPAPAETVAATCASEPISLKFEQHMSQKDETLRIKRKPTRAIRIGPVQIGGGAPVVVQSMTNTDTREVGATLAQLHRLAAAGCEVARLAVPDQKAARALGEIKKESPLPLIADIHFNHRLALAALEQGADAIRINPGNLGGRRRPARCWRPAGNGACRCAWG